MKLSDLLRATVEKLGGEFDANRKSVEDMIRSPSRYSKEQLAEVADIYFQTTLAIREVLEDCIQPVEEMENQINSQYEHNKAVADKIDRLLSMVGQMSNEETLQ